MGGWPVGSSHNAGEELNSWLPRINEDSGRVEDLQHYEATVYVSPVKKIMKS